MKRNDRMFRLTSLLLVLVTAVGMLAACKQKTVEPFVLTERTPASVELFTSGYFDYRKNTDGTAKLIKYTGSDRSLVLPDTLDGCPLVEIDAGAFGYNETLQSIVFNPSLEVIGSYAFIGCVNLSTMEFGKKLWSIGVDALEDTAWMKAQPDDFVIIGDNVLVAYQGTEIAVRVPDGVRHVCSAFVKNDTLKSVFLPDTVVTVGHSAFSNCSSLVHVEMSPNIVLIDQYAFYACTDLVVSRLPSKVEKIGQYCFYDNFSMQALQCGDALKSIGPSAFSNCSNLKSMEIPATLQSIDTNTFEDCVMLSVVYYRGSETQFAEIQYLNDKSSNFWFTDATKIFSEESK